MNQWTLGKGVCSSASRSERKLCKSRVSDIAVNSELLCQLWYRAEGGGSAETIGARNRACKRAQHHDDRAR